MIISRRRLYKRESPSREAKCIFIFCDGAKRERQYFEYFQEIDSRVNVAVYKLSTDEDNSPLGLLAIAKKCIQKDDANPNPKYSFEEGDEVWVVSDIDPDKTNSRLKQLVQVKKECGDKPDWFVALSNPCFEVWLYCHFSESKPTIEEIEKCVSWKRFLSTVKGGFSTHKHPICIETATINAEKNYESQGEFPEIGCTDMFELSKVILELLKDKIDAAKGAGWCDE